MRDGVEPEDQGEGESRGSGHRFVFVLVGLLALGLIAGLATVGLGDDPANTRPRAEGPRGACDAHELEYYVTDDEDEYNRQVAFDASNPDVVPPGFHDEPIDPTVSLHGASHGYVVVSYRPGLPADVMAGLRALQAVGMSKESPVLTVPREQADAIRAVGSEWELTCRAGDADAVRQLVRFAAETSPALAKTIVPTTP
ncbi:MAG: DUF3105 domain-containing protein [Solirubrobacteraceae bacterium]|nr:DUF3105 domain-containing protein [Solirubrobacteraceae bacterium]